MEQEIRFCSAPDGARIAYATVGSGPPLVWTANIYSHLELEWAEPAFRRFFEGLARRYTLVRFDRVGSGLSDRERTDFSLEYEVGTLTAVVDALELDRFPLFGNSQGGKTPIAYAAVNPDRVTHLVLYGSNAAFPYERAIIEPLLAIVRANWHMGARILADGMMPDVDGSAREWFAGFSEQAVSSEAMVRFVEWDADHNVVELCRQIRVPTLVLHRKDDQTVPFEAGRGLASLIPRARFIALEGRSHLPYYDDSEALVRAITGFLGDASEAPAAQPHEQEPRPSGEAVFVSYASEDGVVANRICAALEERGMRCWIAPRDIPPGADYAAAIVEAIDTSRAMVVVFSEHANRSPHVRRELERAVSADLPLLPVRIADVAPTKSLAYFLSTAQWLDAFTEAREPVFSQLAARLQQLAAVGA